MRVLFAITKGEVGGAQEHVRILAHGLIESGHRVAVLVDARSSLADRVQTMGGDVLPWESIVGRPAPVRDRQARDQLRRAVRMWEPDVLHLHSSKAGVLGAGVLAPPDGVTVLTCHHLPFGPGRRWRNRLFARPVEQLVLPRVHGIISVGERDVAVLQRLAPKVALQVVPNAVPVHGPPASDGVRGPTALWVARMAHPKQPLLMVDAWEYVVDAIPDARLVMCGSGPLDGDLRRRIDRSSARSAVTAAGFVEDLHPLYASTSVFVLASRAEGGFTMATLEAMSEGLVPIVSDAGDASALEADDLGVCVRSRSPRAFADAVVGLLQDPDRYQRLRANALMYARERSTPAINLARTEQFYRRVLEVNGLSCP
jgi:glycosyltransferase involved in cell wall biosynthesis